MVEPNRLRDQAIPSTLRGASAGIAATAGTAVPRGTPGRPGWGSTRILVTVVVGLVAALLVMGVALSSELTSPYVYLLGWTGAALVVGLAVGIGARGRPTAPGAMAGISLLVVAVFGLNFQTATSGRPFGDAVASAIGTSVILGVSAAIPMWLGIVVGKRIGRTARAR